MNALMTKDLSRFFRPRSLAIIGASNNIDKPGGKLMHYALKYSSGIKIYPVNPNHSKILGKIAYRSVLEIPDDIDVACISVPKVWVPQSVKDCATKGVKYVIIFTSGFGELGDKTSEISLVELARRNGTRLLGPNCQGVISVAGNYVASYHSCLEIRPIRGKVGVLSQSGALGGYLCSALWDRGIGISHFVSVGNSSDLSIEELLEYYAKDKETDIVILFFEGVRNGTAFRKAAESVRAAGKPLLVIKTGKSEIGKKSAQTHTGSMVGSDLVYSALLKQVGAVRVTKLGELIDAANALAWQPVPHGNRVAFLSTSGAACALMADLSEDIGLTVANLSENTLNKMKMFLPEVAIPKNPLDVVYVYGNPNARTMVGNLIEIMAQDELVDMIIPGMTLSTKAGLEIMENTFPKIEKVVRVLRKPVLWWWATDYDSFGKLRKVFSSKKIPVYPTPEQALSAAAIMVRCARLSSTR